ncbi:phosphoglucosamine mutase [Microbulbifer flavimaris]|uniref:Phosphoglucosamine mutase n=1 Tax=Microbulbifer flavimaris TaxID=1781068 RepID=A0ABX4HYJ8_9GAMM|nr:MULTISPECIES: phosphoglucosamine mutase [Microbulbifer]KUJ82525.1 phosphoglucosamine mutase [Microbulbifer sp. ZGT114]PCO04735.1 phosphoglucosamine mutase [Microbulbifer flavimaris]
MARKYFGTDGIRGRVGEGAITPDFMLRLGYAAGKVLAEGAGGKGGHRPSILIGKDTRISGYMFEAALEAGLINAGVDVGLLGPMPTPAIAYLTRTFHAQAGIVISASHNPFQDNGIKFFSAGGSKLPDQVELDIEAALDLPMVTAEHLGKAWRIDDAAARYIEFCKASTPWGFSLGDMKIVLDCANGATYHIAPKVFRELGAEVIAIGTSPDGQNINLDCGSTKPAKLQQAVVEQGADLGIAFDGDGDRVLFVDSSGNLVDGDELLFLIALHRQQFAGGCSGVVGTQMSNYGFELALKELSIPFERAKVGDRYVLEKMQANDWSLGGESSGHIICADATTTGDGIVSALQVLRALEDFAEPLEALRGRMKMLPQHMINVRLAHRDGVLEHDDVRAAVSRAEEQLQDRGRVLLRPSGTEPLIRVMVEGVERGEVEQLAGDIAQVVERIGNG